MSLLTQAFPILNLEREAPCDHRLADVTPSIMSSQAGRRGMGAKGVFSLASLLPKRGGFLYLTVQNKVTCPLKRWLTGKEEGHFHEWLGSSLGTLLLERGKGDWLWEATNSAWHTHPLSLFWVGLPSRLGLCQVAFSDFHLLVSQTLLHHVRENCPIRVTVYFAKLSSFHVQILSSQPLYENWENNTSCSWARTYWVPGTILGTCGSLLPNDSQRATPASIHSILCSLPTLYQR